MGSWEKIAQFISTSVLFVVVVDVDVLLGYILLFQPVSLEHDRLNIPSSDVELQR